MMRDRASLLAAIADLERISGSADHRIALAEAEFRLAVTTAPEDAEQHLRRAVEHDPFLAKAYLHSGLLRHRQGRRRAALADYRHAVRLAPASRRGHLLIAQSLLEMGKGERDVGWQILLALFGGSAQELSGLMDAVDRICTGTPPDGSEKPGVRRRGAAVERALAPDTWRIVLMDQLAQAKPTAKTVGSCLDLARKESDRDADVTDYATACLLALLAGEPIEQIRGRYDAAGLGEHRSSPAVVALSTCFDLAGLVEDPAWFTGAVTAAVRQRMIPPEVACWLHFDAFTATPSAADAVRILDGYPPDIRELPSFRELRLAVLDTYARRAWDAERFDEARLLWQETIDIDPYRVAIAANLAMLAARTKLPEQYRPAWDRLGELLYLHSAAMDDFRLYSEDRTTLHLALSRQSADRHPSATDVSHQPSRADVAAWIADGDAFDVWLRNWDLYYLNTRLAFRSPIHLLGTSRDASSTELERARNHLARHLASALGGQPWAGMRAFGELAGRRIDEALQAVLSPSTVDEHADGEMARSDALLEEAFDRALLLLRASRHLAGDQRSSASLKTAVAVAERQYALPLGRLQQLCVDRGLISAGEELADLFARSLVDSASAWGDPPPADSDEYADRLALLDACIAIEPTRLELRLYRCRLLGQAGRPEEAYTAAVEALEAPSAIRESEKNSQALARLADIEEQIAEADLPRGMRGVQPRPEQGDLSRTRTVIQRYPRSAGPRISLATALVDLGGDNRVEEAVTLLTEGLRLALTDEHRRRLLARLHTVPGPFAAAAVRRFLDESSRR